MPVPGQMPWSESTPGVPGMRTPARSRLGAPTPAVGKPSWQQQMDEMSGHQGVQGNQGGLPRPVQNTGNFTPPQTQPAPASQQGGYGGDVMADWRKEYKNAGGPPPPFSSVNNLSPGMENQTGAGMPSAALPAALGVQPMATPMPGQYQAPIPLAAMKQRQPVSPLLASLNYPY